MINSSEPKLSIIIPVLNEEALIREQLEQLRRSAPNAELIVVDGGSQDDTLKIARSLVDVVLQTAPGRAVQMNAGAEQARGEYLLFLHVDTCLPGNLEQLFTKWSQTKPYWGYFPLRLSGAKPALRIVERMINLRTKVTSGATGDQCQVFSARVFKSQGGFPLLPLMEDLAMSRQMRRLVPPKIFPAPVVTSSRRWEQKGVVRTIFTMWALRLIYSIGVHPRYFYRFYYPREQKLR